MPTQTPRQALDKYAQDESPWSHDDLVDFVDEYSIERDVIANRPNGTYDDEFYYATDEKRLYSWNSGTSSWDLELSLSHADLTNITSNDHHSKTSSASELTDVSPDSSANAHHSQSHDNTDHTQEYVSDGDDITREIWVITAGASDPSGAGVDDLIFEEK